MSHRAFHKRLFWILLVVPLCLDFASCGHGDYFEKYYGELTIEPNEIALGKRASVTVHVVKRDKISPAVGVNVWLSSYRNYTSKVDFIDQPEGDTDSDGLAVAQIASSVDGQTVLSVILQGTDLCDMHSEQSCYPLTGELFFFKP